MRARVIAIGGSAGALAPLMDILEKLPADFPVPVVVAIHSSPKGQLTETLQLMQRVDMPCRELSDGETLEPGVVHVVPPARHALFCDGVAKISDLVTDSGFRPSIDAMFMTLAAQYNNGVVAVVLSGTMDDGMRGAQVIYDLGGKTLVQHPGEAGQSEMPRQVIHADHPHRVLHAHDLGRWLADNITA